MGHNLGLRWMVAALALLGLTEEALAYVDPGTSQQVWMALGPLIAILVGAASVFLLPFRWVLGFVKRGWLRLPRWARAGLVCAVAVGVAVSLVALGKAMGQAGAPGQVVREEKPRMRFKRVLVLGMDGLDPNLLQSMMKDGSLPNFAKLAETGSFSPLQTTIPPESPVAWLVAATGCNPGQTGVFDFIRRDPKTYVPDLSLLRSKRRGMLSGSEGAYAPASEQPAMWDILSAQGIPATVIRWPGAFPPVKVAGRMLSGLGTLDVCGTMGRYRFFTTKEVTPDDKAADRVTRVSWQDGRIVTELPGPDVLSFGGTKTSGAPLKVEKTDKDGVSITIGKAQAVKLDVGQWSGWTRVTFPGGLSRACPAMVKMFLTSVEPEFGLYVTPLHADPEDPACPLSSPKEYSRELAREIRLYATLGMPEDTQAVQHGRIPLSAFLELCDQITSERERMFERELKLFKEGGLFVVFDTSDRIQHMLWAATDREHPGHTAELEKQYGHVIRDHYRRMDKVVGTALQAASDGQTAIIVISDHGFTRFSRAAHLNTWLVRNGFMVLRDGASEGAPLLRSLDWSKTKAYAVGFCSLFINRQGREGQGSVTPEEYARVREEVARALKSWKDPETGAPVVRSVYFGDEVYRGKRTEDAPDIVVGYYPGHRASWQTALGAAPAGETVVANDEVWSGDHLVDAPCVPGIFLSSQKLRGVRPKLADIAPSVLELLGASVPTEAEGKQLF